MTADERKGGDLGMKKKTVMRLVSLCMLIAAVVFVVIALGNPQLGRVIWIGPFRFGVKEWYVCYGLYVLVMIGLFIGSFFVREKKK